MTRLISRLSDLGTRYRAVYCDLWGCLHNGLAAYPDAVAALQAFRATGGKVILLTNAPRPKSSIKAQITRLGVPPDAWDDIATSGDSAQYALLAGAVGHRVHHIGAQPKDDAFFTDFAADLEDLRAKGPPITRVALEEAEGIVCTGPVDEFNDKPEDYRTSFLYAKAKGMKLLCANPDLVVDLGDRRIFCAGALAEYYTKMGGESLYFGKPHPPIYDLARRRLTALDSGITDEEILCIGDGIGTDIAGGGQEGLDTLFLTEGLMAGKFGAPDALDPEKVETFLASEGCNATFAMGFLR
ncbi:MAG: TIGR01459 family HAD-type hydrolase [Pseudorhodobacter sp.]